MTDRDQQLRTLIETVQQQPSTSLTWRRAMNQLLLEIQRLPGLARSPHPSYGEVLDDALLKLAEDIHSFEPRQSSLEASLTAWINLKLRLKYEVLNLHTPQRSRSQPSDRPSRAKIEFRQQAQKPPLSLDVTLGSDGNRSFADHLPSSDSYSLWDLEDRLQREQEEQSTIAIGSRLQTYIDTDPDYELRQCHPQAYPNCHCQMLSQRLLLKQPPDRMAAIARDYDINYHTLNWHWKKRGIPLLQAIAQKLGYQPDR